MNSAPRIRPYEAGDGPALALAFNRAVGEIAALVYEREQIEAWLDGGMTAEDCERRCGDGRLVWVAVDEGNVPQAFIDLEADGHIDMLFCGPERAGRGLASALYTRLEEAARERGITRLYVEASEVAKPFFLRRGFALLCRNDFTRNGALLHNYSLEKPLSAT
jgi:putative acetyltransferase